MERKTFELKLAEDGWMVASTPAIDRDRDRVMPMGAQVGNFEKNPVLIFGHNYHEPWSLIGRAADLQISGQDIRFRPELRQPANDNDPMNIVRALWDQGLLRAASIGFNPLEWKDNDFGGRDFTSWELLEISLVPVPANQEALRMAAKAISEAKEQREPAAPVAVDDTAVEEEEGETLDTTPEVVEETTAPVSDEPDEDEALLQAIDNFLASVADAIGGNNG